MQSTQKYLTVTDLGRSQSAICYNMKKIGKESKQGVRLSQTLCEKNKEDRISIATSLLSKQRNDQFFKNVITDDKKNK